MLLHILYVLLSDSPSYTKIWRIVFYETVLYETKAEICSSIPYYSYSAALCCLCVCEWNGYRGLQEAGKFFRTGKYSRRRRKCRRTVEQKR